MLCTATFYIQCEPPFFELEKAMFTVATAVRVLTIITPGP